MGYKEYLASPEWAERRGRVIERDMTCVLCDSNKNLQVHHRSYENIGRERMKDLTTLCERCHRLVSAASRVMGPRKGEFVEDFSYGPDADPATAEQIKEIMDKLRTKAGWQ